MMPLWSAMEAAAATGGQAIGEWQAAGVSIDSRTITPGDLFIALTGPNFDGHNFVADALAKSAAAAVVTKRPPGIDENAPLLIVADTQHALERQGRSFASSGSLNNHWGVPLSLARMPRDARFGIFELGMNHAGEIDALTRIVQPDVAVITTIEPVHLGFFASVEAIADAKAEIFNGVPVEGAAILNRDNAFFDRLAAAAEARGITRILSFGA